MRGAPYRKPAVEDSTPERECVDKWIDRALLVTRTVVLGFLALAGW